MSGFVAWLERYGQEDSRVRAVLRRSLAFSPGEYIEALRYVERFVAAERDDWRRAMHYLVAGLWASHWREGRVGPKLTLGRACAVHQFVSGSANTERRFISLLDADRDQLSQRLRQIVALLKDQSIDFESLLAGLLHWNYDGKPTQFAWARDYYRGMAQYLETDPTMEETETV